MTKMKNIKYFLMLLVAMLSMTACNKMSHNGDLDGRWQITRMVYHSTGQEIDGPIRVYWDFSLDLMDIVDMRPGKSFFTYSRFDHHDGRLKVATIGASVQGLRPRGLCDTIVDFRVETLNRSTMILDSDSTLLEFRKF